jgi:uncharacterized protein affecting Mg2+/Co2+ transport
MLPSAQLSTRHWTAHTTNAAGKVVESVRLDGKAVVGSHPHLAPGRACNYTSCIHGKFGDDLQGHFMFVPGTMQHPRGLEVQVKCPQLVWEDPGFVY